MIFGCVSWIRPGTYYENAALIAKHVDFVELLVFTWDKEVRTLLLNELDKLKKLNVLYTVHLPTDTIQHCTWAYDFFMTHKFPINNYVLHPIDGWLDFIRNKPDVTLENLIQSSEAYERMTLDLGHLMLSTNGEEIFASEVVKEIKEFHIHGIRGGKDHQSIDDNTTDCLTSLIKKHRVVRKSLENHDTMINFEIFDYYKFLESIQRFKNAFG